MGEGARARAACVGLATLALLVSVHQAAAQVPVVAAESLRDPGRPETAGAIALALGGARVTGIGDAMDAALNPATLLRGTAWDAVWSLGVTRYARDELQRSFANGAAVDTWRRRGNSPKPIGAAAIAYRWSWIAAGAFVDSVSRIDHNYQVDRVLRSSPSPLGTTRYEVATESFSTEALRVGGSVGLRVPGDVAVVGVSLHGRRTRVAHAYEGTYTDVANQGGYPPDILHVWRDLAVNDWGVGFTLGGVVRVHRRVDAAVRFVHEPRAPALLVGTTDISPYISQWYVKRFEVSLDAPDELQAGLSVRAGALRLVAEAGAVLAVGTFRDPEGPCTTKTPGPFVLPVTRIENCWKLLTPSDLEKVRRPNILDVRLGAERLWRRGRWSWALRAGASRGTAPVLQPDPLEPNAFVPIEPPRTWLHAGGGAGVGRLGVDVGASRWQGQYRVLMDLRWRSAR